MMLVPSHIGGHQVGRELDAVEFEIQRHRQRADERGFAQAGNAFEQCVTADEEARQYAVDDFGVTDDHLGDLGLDGPVISSEVVRESLDLRVDAGDVLFSHDDPVYGIGPQPGQS